MTGFVNNFFSSDFEATGNFVREMKSKMLKDAENLHLKALDTSLNAVGENTLLVAKSYCNLGRLYQSQGKYKVIFIIIY